MKFSSRSRILIGVALVALIISIAIVLGSIRQANVISEEINIANQLVQEISSMQLILNDLEYSQSERPEKQMEFVEQNLTDLLSGVDFENSEKIRVLNIIKDDIQRIHEITAELRLLQEQLPGLGVDDRDGKLTYKRILGQQVDVLFLNTIKHSFQLRNLIETDREVAEMTNNVSMIILFSVLTLVIVVTSQMLNKTQEEAISKLIKIAEEISDGNLNFQPLLDTSDDFDPVYSSFTTMVDQVRLNYTNFQQEVAERKEAERELRIERNNLENIFKAMNDGVYLVNQEYDIEYVNQVLVKDFGLYEGIKCYTYFHDREDVCPWCKNQDVFAGKTVRWEWTSEKNGRTYDLIDTPLKNPDGSLSKLEIFRDITERKQTEELLKESERKLQKILTTVPLGIGLITDRKLGWSNDRMHEMLGYPDGGLIGKSVKILYENEKEYNRAGKIAYEMMIDKGIGEVETRWKRKDNSIFDCLIRITPLNISNPSEGNIAVISNITERKQTEEELNKYQYHLEELVKERTAELEGRTGDLEESQKAVIYLLEDLNDSRQALEEVNKKLLNANEELESFSYSVSHDLRAPLRAIDSFTRILMEDYVADLDDEGKRLGSVIQKSAKKMGRLIDDLLAFSRLGRAAMSFSEIEMKKMVKTIYQEETDAKARKRITFTIANLPNVKGDPAMMHQLWTNLISNALKFSAQVKKAVISVSCQEEDDQLIYCIKDNGVGFNMKYKDKLFSVFQRLHSEKEFEGTGVGLALVQQIIQRHGGEVWAEGEVDHGSAFYFSLPKNRRTK